MQFVVYGIQDKCEYKYKYNKNANVNAINFSAEMENNEEKTKITRFTDLVAWQESHKLVLGVYELVEDFPNTEKFALSSQITRAVVSISSNIAEGFARDSWLDKSRFYNIAQTSLIEVQNHLIIAKDLGYINNTQFVETSKQTIICHKLIIGLIKCAKKNGYK